MLCVWMWVQHMRDRTQHHRHMHSTPLHTTHMCPLLPQALYARAADPTSGLKARILDEYFKASGVNAPWFSDINTVCVCLCGGEFPSCEGAAASLPATPTRQAHTHTHDRNRSHLLHAVPVP